MCILGKTVSSDVLGTILLKDYQEMLKYLFPALVFNVDTLVNIAFDQVLNFALLENTVQLQEVVRQKH
jgi:iron complex outermembrane receptor protein